MRQHHRDAARRATHMYALLLRLYPRAHRQAFGRHMLQAFADHYRDAVETGGESATRYWLGVVADEGRSLLREHLAALTGRDHPVKRLFALSLSLATSATLLTVAVLLVSAAALFSQVAPTAGWRGLMDTHPDLSTFAFSAAVQQPTSDFISTFTQSADAIAQRELRAYHFKPARVEISTYPLALATTGAPLPAILLDGEPAARLTTDLRLVQGRLPVPASGRLEVALTQTTADQLHLTLGAIVPIAAYQAPLVRVVGIVEVTNAAFPTDRQGFDPVNQDQVRGYVQSNPLDYALTSTDAIGAYTFDWSQIISTEEFYDKGGPDAHPLPRGSGPPLWQAWWIAQADFSQMSAQELTAVYDGTPPDPSARLNQLLSERVGSQDTGFVPADTSSGFFQGDSFNDYRDSALFYMIFGWLLLAVIVGVVMFCLGRIAGTLAQRQEPLIAVLRRCGAGRGRLLGAFTLQTLAVAGVALIAGGLLAAPAVHLAAALWLPASEWHTVGGLDGGPFQVGVVGGSIAALVLLVAVLVMLRAMGGAAARLPQGGQQEASV